MSTELVPNYRLSAYSPLTCTAANTYYVRVPVLLRKRPINRSADRREVRIPNWTFTSCWLAGDGESRNISAIYKLKRDTPPFHETDAFKSA
jgi:hypothetical protein